jgi:hypothetical protein
MQLENFKNKGNHAIKELKAVTPTEAIIVHHDDADGLSKTLKKQDTLTAEIE